MLDGGARAAEALQHGEANQLALVWDGCGPGTRPGPGVEERVARARAGASTLGGANRLAQCYVLGVARCAPM